MSDVVGGVFSGGGGVAVADNSNGGMRMKIKLPKPPGGRRRQYPDSQGESSSSAMDISQEVYEVSPSSPTRVH